MVWAQVLGRSVNYGCDDPTMVEQNMAPFMPKWMAYEMRLMAERYVSEGMLPETGDIERLTKILGRSLHSYRDFATQFFVVQQTPSNAALSRRIISQPIV
ncbi:hypothetical protein GCM10007868_20020 [Gluconobacter frateurii]|nr:hypothetical protein A0J51_02030 [Gluconobacter japonicus]GLP90927.1 hypothetical protein GCM10007868_20020 [Gluconobacter frateurii]